MRSARVNNVDILFDCVDGGDCYQFIQPKYFQFYVFSNIKNIHPQTQRHITMNSMSLKWKKRIHLIIYSQHIQVRVYWCSTTPHNSIAIARMS